MEKKNAGVYQLTDVAILAFFSDGYPDAVSTTLADMQVDTLRKFYLYIDNVTSIKKRQAIRSLLKKILPAGLEFVMRVLDRKVLHYLCVFHAWIPDSYKFQRQKKPVTATARCTPALADKALLCRVQGGRQFSGPTSWASVARVLGITPAHLRELRESDVFESSLREMAIARYAYDFTPKMLARAGYREVPHWLQLVSGIRDGARLERIWRDVLDKARALQRETGE